LDIFSDGTVEYRRTQHGGVAGVIDSKTPIYPASLNALVLRVVRVLLQLDLNRIRAE
jgi:hypothetical protein